MSAFEISKGITKPSIQRLARSAGAKRISGSTYDEIRIILVQYLQKLVEDSIVSMKFSKRKTLQLEDVKVALRQLGTVYGGTVDKSCHVKQSKKSKSDSEHRFHPGTQALREITYYQKHSDCLVLAKAPFERLIRATDAIVDEEGSIRISTEAKIALQLASEIHLRSLLEDAVAIAHASRRETLYPKDIQATRRIREKRV